MKLAGLGSEPSANCKTMSRSVSDMSTLARRSAMTDGVSLFLLLGQPFAHGFIVINKRTAIGITALDKPTCASAVNSGRPRAIVAPPRFIARIIESVPCFQITETIVFWIVV